MTRLRALAAASLVLVPSAALAAPDAAVLVSHWTFDEPAGNATAHDSAGKYDGTLLGGASFQSGGISGNCVSLDKATSSLVKFGPSFPGFATGSFSFAFWLKTTTVDADTFVLTKEDAAVVHSYFVAVNEFGSPSPFGAPGKVTFPNFTPGSDVTSTTTVTDGVWHHVVGVHAAGDLYSLYVDGAPAEAAKFPFPISESAAPLYLGGSPVSAGVTATYTGLVDDLQIYSGALTDAQVDELFAHPGRVAAGQDSPLIAHWRFDEITGTTAADSTGRFDGMLSTTGSSFVAGGASGNAISLNRALSGFVSAGDVLDLTGGDFSISLWTNTSTPDDETFGVSKHNEGAVDGFFVSLNSTEGGGAAGKTTFVASTSPATAPTSTATVTDGRWRHVVGVHRAGTGNSIYVDGAPVGSTASAAPIMANGAPFLIGGVFAAGAATGRFDGLIDDVQVYRGALTDEQIAFLAVHPGKSTLDAPTARHDLVRDWSETANPNGVWTLREGSNTLPHLADWGAGVNHSDVQPAWALSPVGTPPFVPAWMRSTGAETFVHDFRAGDVVVLTTDATDGPGAGDANVVWTSPLAGTVDVRGGLWMGRDIGRAVDWKLSKNGAVFTQGSLASGDAFDRSRPFLVTAGSGALAAVSHVAVQPGDKLELRLTTTSTRGDYVGVNLSVDALRGTTVVAATGDDAPGVTGGKFKSFGHPAIDADGRMAFRGQLQPKVGGVTGANASGVWVQGAGDALRLVARTGDIAPFTAARFASFSDPVIGESGRVAFVAKIKGTGASGAGATGIWFHTGDELRPVARGGDGAPGAIGTRFSKFVAVGLPAEGGPVFLATLSGASRTTNVGVWRADSYGRLDLMARTGSRVPIAAGAKNIQTLQFLPAPKFVGGQTHGFDRFGSLAVRATFTDGTQGILTFSSRAHAVPATGFPAPAWRLPDSQIGASSSVIEDFEDAFLADGLEVSLSGGTADFGPTTVLPHAFDPRADDPNAGQNFVSSLWDGSRLLLNRRNAPLPVGYVDGEWADLTLSFPASASSVGFGLGNVDSPDTPITVLRTSGATTNVLSDFLVTGSRNGYVRFDSGTGDSILSVKIDNVSGDQFALDHLGFHATPPDPSATSIGVSGDLAPGATTGARFATMGAPAISDSARIAFRAGMLVVGQVTKANAAGIWAEQAAGLTLVARQASPAPGTQAPFATLSDPVNRTDGAVAFVGTLGKATGVTKSDAVGIWSDAGGATSLVARQGSPAPGAAAGATFASFVSLGLNDRGVVVLAKLKGTGVTSKNATGIWAVDDDGVFGPALRFGDQIMAGGANRIVKKFDFLPAIPVVGGQTRGFDAKGDLALRASFTDKTEAVVRIVP